jgi:hypothetical protein
MKNAIQSISVPGRTDAHDLAYDLMRGVAQYMGNPLLAGLVRVLAKHPGAEIGVAFNPKQVSCKVWARDQLFTSVGGSLGAVWIVGGWYGAMLLDDRRFQISKIESFDIDPAVEDVARTLIGESCAAFKASTRDMYALDYMTSRPDLVVNTSCEHIADLRGWLGLLPRGTLVLLQSNDYFAEPEHIGCVASLDEFSDSAGLREVIYSGSLPQRKYTRFMLIGRV